MNSLTFTNPIWGSDLKTEKSKAVFSGWINNVTLNRHLSHPRQVTTGTTSLTPRWDKCVNYVENSLVYATGRLFVDTHFQDDKKHMVCVCFHHNVSS